FVAVVGTPVVLPALKITIEAVLIFTGKTLVLVPIIAVAVSITVPFRSPIPIPVAVPIPFPLPIAIPVPVRAATVAGNALKAYIVRNSVVIVNVKHTLLHADHFVAVVGTS